MRLQIKCGLFVHFSTTSKTLSHQADTIESFKLLLIRSCIFVMENILTKQGYVVITKVLNLPSFDVSLRILGKKIDTSRSTEPKKSLEIGKYSFTQGSANKLLLMRRIFCRFINYAAL